MSVPTTPFTRAATAGLGLLAAATFLAAPAAAQAAPTATTTVATASVSTTNHKAWATAVLTQLNAERAQHGLKPLRRSSKLTSSAHKHNLAMAKKNTLSHQLPGEKSLGPRVTAAHFRWSTCGENIAWNSDRSEAGVLALETAMVNETPPNDGHRRNILSAAFVNVGVDVIDDKTHGRVWLTTDFGTPR